MIRLYRHWSRHQNLIGNSNVQLRCKYVGLAQKQMDEVTDQRLTHTHQARQYTLVLIVCESIKTPFALQYLFVHANASTTRLVYFNEVIKYNGFQ